MTDSENDGEERYSNYLQYLPAFYREDDFTGRFLNIFEDILKPIVGTVDNLAFYFDPGTAPQSFLPWLASWVGLVMDERWPEARRRQLIKSVVELYRWRGTKRGLSEYLRIYTGVVPQITEPVVRPEAKLDPGTRLGTEVHLGGGEPFIFDITIAAQDLAEVDIDVVRAIIESQKPAHTTYTLKVLPQGPTEGEE
jgi:phage tail-like protein